MSRAFPHSPYDADKPWLLEARQEAFLSNYIFLTDLPTEDPFVVGALWNNSGTPEVSASSHSTSPSVSPSHSASPST